MGGLGEVAVVVSDDDDSWNVEVEEALHLG